MYMSKIEIFFFTARILQNQRMLCCGECFHNYNHIINYITSVFHWNVTIWLAMKWLHDYKSDVSYPNETQIWTCTCLHDDVRCKQSMA
jgi:hypothetical protein